MCNKIVNSLIYNIIHETLHNYKINSIQMVILRISTFENQRNEHASNYSRIKQRQRMRRYTIKMHT